jgi:hypothetical protein
VIAHGDDPYGVPSADGRRLDPCRGELAPAAIIVQ